MIYHLMEMLQDSIGALRVFTFVNFRIAMAIFSGLIICYALGPWLVKKLVELQIGQNIREEGPKSHQKKAGTPTMGGLLILAGITIPTLLWANLTNLYVWVLVGSTLAFGIIGFLDDFLKIKRGKNKGLGARQKSGLQIIAALAVGIVLFTFAQAPEGEEKEYGDFSTKLTIPFVKQMVVEKVEGETEVVKEEFLTSAGCLSPLCL